MTIEELIQDLDELRDKYGPHIEVFTQKWNICDGTIVQVPVTEVKSTVDNDRIVLV